MTFAENLCADAPENDRAIRRVLDAAIDVREMLEGHRAAVAFDSEGARRLFGVVDLAAEAEQVPHFPADKDGALERVAAGQENRRRAGIVFRDVRPSTAPLIRARQPQRRGPIRSGDIPSARA